MSDAQTAANVADNRPGVLNLEPKFQFPPDRQTESRHPARSDGFELMDLDVERPTTIVDLFRDGELTVTHPDGVSAPSGALFKQGRRLRIPADIDDATAARWVAGKFATREQTATIIFRKCGPPVAGLPGDELFGMVVHARRDWCLLQTGRDGESVRQSRPYFSAGEAPALWVCEGRLPEDQLATLPQPCPWVAVHNQSRPDLRERHVIRVRTPSGQAGFLPWREAIEREHARQVAFVNQVEDFWQGDRQYRRELRGGRRAG